MAVGYPVLNPIPGLTLLFDGIQILTTSTFFIFDRLLEFTKGTFLEYGHYHLNSTVLLI